MRGSQPGGHMIQVTKPRLLTRPHKADLVLKRLWEEVEDIMNLRQTMQPRLRIKRTRTHKTFLTGRPFDTSNSI